MRKSIVALAIKGIKSLSPPLDMHDLSGLVCTPSMSIEPKVKRGKFKKRNRK